MKPMMMTFAAVSAAILLFLTYPFISLALTVSPDILSQVMRSDEAFKALVLSIEAATTSTAILLVAGLPLSYILARFEFRGKRLVESIIDLPLVVPHAVVGIMILTAYGSRTSLGSMLQNLGVVVENSFWGIVAAFCFVSTPLLIDTVRDGIASIDPYMEGVARTLGAGPMRALISITLPLSTRSIFTGALLAWARAMSEVGALLIIAYYPKTINVLIVEWFNTYGLQYAAALTIILLMISLTIFTLLRLALRWRE